MVFVSILLNLFNSKHLLKIEKIILPEKSVHHNLSFARRETRTEKKKQDTKVDTMLKSRLEGSFVEKSQRVFNQKAKSVANFVGKEQDPKLSDFDLFTSTAGNLELRNLSLFFELMLEITPSAANV